MKRASNLTLAVCIALAIAACGRGDVGGDVGQAPTGAESAGAAAVSRTAPQPADDPAATRPGSPFRISYRIIGTPIIGSPVTIELSVESASGPRAMTLDYRINDSAAMVLAESQLPSVRLEPATGENVVTQQVTIVPQREGRSYLNVSASVETGEGTRSSVLAIPVQVRGGRQDPLPGGELAIDE